MGFVAYESLNLRIQAHAGRDFFVPEGKEISFDIDECPYLHISIKAEKDTKTCLFLMVHDKKPNDHKNRFVVIGKTPEGDPGIYDVITDCFTIEDDNQWHEYDFDLRNIQKKDDEYPYFSNAGSVSIIEFYSWTGSGEHTFHFNDLVCKPITTEAALNELRVARALEPAPEGKPSSLGDLLGTMPKTEAFSRKDQLTVAMLHDKHGNTDNFWEQAKASGLSSAIPVLKRTLALGELTTGHAPIVQALQARSDAQHPESLEFLIKLEPTDWIELVFEHGVSPASGFDRDEYIEHLQSQVESKFPMQMLGKQLKKNLIKSFPTDKVLNFMDANPDFNFKTMHLEPYLNEKDKQDDTLRKGLLKLTCIDALTQKPQETVALLDAGFGSAAQMVNMGRQAYKRKVANYLLPERAEEIFAAAEKVHTTVIALAAVYTSPVTKGNAVAVIPSPSASKEVLKNYPSMRTLFGELDYCECRHCQSSLGPAAYLADLMHFLQHSPLTPNLSLSPANYKQKYPYLEFAAGGTVLGVLLQRRPDLADLELTCENTNTEMPYIDLVLEILENAVALPLMLVGEDAFVGIDINKEFESGKVPDIVVNLLRKIDIRVGKNLTVIASSFLDSNSPFITWIIIDGSRRWLIQHRKRQSILYFTGSGSFQVLDEKSAVDSLEHGTLNSELEKELSHGLPIAGSPQIKETPEFSEGRLWTINYTRAIAIKTTEVDFNTYSIELLDLGGTQLRVSKVSYKTKQFIVSTFTSGTTSKINPNVAQLLELPVNETYLQTWNPTKNWWELSIKNAAVFTQFIEGLYVSGLTYQNSSVSEQLKSNPENRISLAYEKLSENAVYPWALPFDLWLEETRAFLDALGIPRANIIDLARPQSHLSEEAVALELLGLSKSEADLIASAMTSTEPWIYWGLLETNNKVVDQTAGTERTGSWQDVLTPVSMLLQQSGLSYREYLDFLQTSFAGQPKPTLSPPRECKTSKVTLSGLSKTEFTNHLNRIHIFTRLWRKSGWSMQELDLALAAFGGQITPTIVQDLALLKRLNTGSGLSVRVLVGCIDKLNTKAWKDHAKEGTPTEPALYNSVFQRQSLRSLTDFDDFDLEKLSSTTLKISDRSDFIAASLGIKPAQVMAWITGTPNLGIAEDLVNLDSLSQLYAAASLCHTLKIAPDAMPRIVTLLGKAANPFLTVSATPVEQVRARAYAMLEFVERIGFVRESGFDFENLSYLLQHKRLAGSASDVSTKFDQQIAQILTELRSALQAGVVLGDVSADNLKRQLACLGWYPALIDAMMGSDGLNYQPGASVKVEPPLAKEPVFPLNLRSKFTYQTLDSTTAELECTGSLIDKDFTSIDNLNLFHPGEVTALKAKYNIQLDTSVKSNLNCRIKSR